MEVTTTCTRVTWSMILKSVIEIQVNLFSVAKTRVWINVIKLDVILLCTLLHNNLRVSGSPSNLTGIEYGCDPYKVCTLKA